jgi:hypothetical protein
MDSTTPRFGAISVFDFKNYFEVIPTTAIGYRTLNSKNGWDFNFGIAPQYLWKTDHIIVYDFQCNYLFYLKSEDQLGAYLGAGLQIIGGNFFLIPNAPITVGYQFSTGKDRRSFFQMQFSPLVTTFGAAFGGELVPPPVSLEYGYGF